MWWNTSGSGKIIVSLKSSHQNVHCEITAICFKRIPKEIRSVTPFALLLRLSNIGRSVCDTNNETWGDSEIDKVTHPLRSRFHRL